MNTDHPSDETSTSLAVLTMIVGQIISELTRSKRLDPEVMRKLCEEVETAIKNDGLSTDKSISLLSYLKETIND